MGLRNKASQFILNIKGTFKWSINIVRYILVKNLWVWGEIFGSTDLGWVGSSQCFQLCASLGKGICWQMGRKNLSCAAREVLLKANAQSVPTYPMIFLKLSPLICRKLTSVVSNYWWGSSLDNHKIPWLRWEKLTHPRSQGGIGFRDFSLFNQAMLGKQGWRLRMRPGSLCAKVLHGKYFPNGDFLTATKRRRCSETWRSTLYGRDVLKKGLI